MPGFANVSQSRWLDEARLHYTETSDGLRITYDPALREGFMALLLEACRAAGSTLVFVSHDERLAAQFDRRLSLPDLNQAPR